MMLYLLLLLLFVTTAAAKGSMDREQQQLDQTFNPSIISSNEVGPQKKRVEDTKTIPAYNRILIGLVLSPVRPYRNLKDEDDDDDDNYRRRDVKVSLLGAQIQNRLNQLVNENISRSYQIELITTEIVENPIEMSEIVCKQLIGNLGGGVSAVIVDTTTDQHYLDSIASISFTLALYNIPVIGTTLRDSPSLFNKNVHSTYISMIPPNSHQADVWFQLMMELKFKRAFVLSSADNHDLLARLVDLIDGQQQSNDGDRFQLEAIIEYDTLAFGGGGSMDTAGWSFLVNRVTSLLENSICRVFLIHAQSREDVILFLNLIEHLNMTSIEGSALILSEQTVQVAQEMDLNLPEGSIWSRLSLMSASMANDSPQARESFAMDALDIVLRGVEQVIDHLNFEQAKLPNSCLMKPSDIDWHAGVELYWAIRRQQFAGLTGYISFDDNGDRLTARYELRNAVWDTTNDATTTRTVGEFWNGAMKHEDKEGIDYSRDLESKIFINISSIVWPDGSSGHLISGVYIDRHLKIVTIEEKPFVWVLQEQDCWRQQQSTLAAVAGVSIPCRRLSKRGQGAGNGAGAPDLEKLCCKGYCMDLLREISRRLNFTYDLYLAPDNQYGILSPERPSSARTTKGTGGHRMDTRGTMDGDGDPDESMTMNWTQSNLLEGGQEDEEYQINGAKLKWDGGLMGELVSRRADMAFAPLTITLKRAQAIDFSKPFKFHGFSILLRRASKHTTLASFLQPFHNLLWMLVIGVATHVVALTLYLLDRYSTFGSFGIKRGFILEPPATLEGGGGGSSNEIGQNRPLHLSSSIWFSWSILLNSGVGEHTPKSLSGRVLGIFWSGFAMIVVASYTANLAAFLVLDSREETPTLSGIDDPRLRSGDLAFNFATIKNSAVDAYLQSQVEYLNLYRKMEEFDFGNVDEAIRALRQGSIDALIWDSTRLEWEVATDENCGLGIAGELFGNGGYGIGLQKGSHWTKNVTRKLLELHESGYMIELDKLWIAAGRGASGGSGSELEAYHHLEGYQDNSSDQIHYSNGGGGGSSNCGRRNEDKPETLGIFNIAGIFILFACGLVTSMGLIVLERLCYKHRKSTVAKSEVVQPLSS